MVNWPAIIYLLCAAVGFYVAGYATSELRREIELTESQIQRLKDEVTKINN
jgi:hypothetical protein